MDDNRPAPEPGNPVIVEGNVVPSDPMAVTAPRAILTPDGDELSPLLGEPVPHALTLQTPPVSDMPTPTASDPEFDAYMAIVKLIIGGTIEGAAELVNRLEKWEAELNDTEDTAQPGQIQTNGDAARFMLVGMTLAASEGVRQQIFKLAQASDVFWRLTGSAAQPLVNNRLTGIVTRPLDRAFDRLVNRGQARVNRWVELGRTHEPGARRIARKTYLEIVDEFIGHLAKNEELADLVQEQGMGLASEAVDEFRSRTVSADAIAENLVRRILRRPPRQELPGPPEDIRLVITDGSAGSE